MSEEEKVFYSPDTRARLERTDDPNIYHDRYIDADYRVGDDGSIRKMVYYSPDTMARLERTEDPHVYYDHYIDRKYYVTDEGKMVKMVNPMSGLPVTKRDDGLYEGNNQLFSLDEVRGALIPQFVPDDTLEPAHIVGDSLVGNETGRRFPITDAGKVLVPFDPIEINPDATPQEIDAYFRSRRERQLSESQEDIARGIAYGQELEAKAIERMEAQLRADVERSEREFQESIPPHLRKASEVLTRIAESAKKGVVTESDFSILMDAMGYNDDERAGLTRAFTLAGKIIPDKQDDMDVTLGSSGRGAR